MTIPDSTPVILGVGQVTEHLGAENPAFASPQILASEAAQIALNNTGNGQHLLPLVDVVAFVRTFADSVPDVFRHLFAPFGGSDNLPRSVAQRLGVQPDEAILSKACGDEPQRLIAELCERVAGGEIRAGLVCGAEAIATTRTLQAKGATADWAESPGGQLSDRGQGTEALFEAELGRHGAIAPIDIYPLLENARRHELRLHREDYRQSMASLFARFARVAASNPLAMSQKLLTAEAIASESEGNRLIAEPYLKAFVARDWVNQGAAALVTSWGIARQFGVERQAVFLHGHAHATEYPVLRRPRLNRSPAMAWAYQQALAAADISSHDVAGFDLYSCFPIAVFGALDALGLSEFDSRALTLTGGLPFFGGPGNNYSLHGIAEAVNACRDNPGARYVVGANGGHLTKHAVGVYSTTPAPLRIACERPVDRDEVSCVSDPQGHATIETYTIKPRKGGAPEVIAIGRLCADNTRFVAQVDSGDGLTLARFVEADPLGCTVEVTAGPDRNRITMPLT